MPRNRFEMKGLENERGRARTKCIFLIPSRTIPWNGERGRKRFRKVGIVSYRDIDLSALQTLRISTYVNLSPCFHFFHWKQFHSLFSQSKEGNAILIERSFHGNNAITPIQVSQAYQQGKKNRVKVSIGLRCSYFGFIGVIATLVNEQWGYAFYTRHCKLMVNPFIEEHPFIGTKEETGTGVMLTHRTFFSSLHIDLGIRDLPSTTNSGVVK